MGRWFVKLVIKLAIWGVLGLVRVFLLRRGLSMTIAGIGEESNLIR